jgi:hypothetical protein
MLAVSELILAASICAAQQSQSLDSFQQGDSAISVQVVDMTGAVIQDAAVSLEKVPRTSGPAGKTNQVGTYQATGLAEGEYVVSVRARGFQDAGIAVSLGPNEAMHTVVTLQIGSPNDMGPPFGGPPAPMLEPIVSDVHPEFIRSTVDPAMIRLTPTQAPPRQNSIKHFFSTLGHKLGF